MASLRDVMVYLALHYPHPHELSNGRLTKMVYLGDWKSAVQRGSQLTPVHWYFDHFGPYVHDIIETANADPVFEVSPTLNAYGDTKRLISVRPDARHEALTKEDEDILDFVISNTSARYWKEFIQLVYSTYPIMSQPKYSWLDLGTLASRYREERETYLSST